MTCPECDSSFVLRDRRGRLWCCACGAAPEATRCSLCGSEELEKVNEHGSRRCGCGAWTIVALPAKTPRIGEDDLRLYLAENAEVFAEDDAALSDMAAVNANGITRERGA